MHMSKRRIALPLLMATAALTLSASGCGGVIKFEDTTPFTIGAPPPPPPPPRVEVKQDRIEINEKIQFELDQATIMEASHGLLNEIVDVLQKNSQIKKVDIIGHTDSDGSDTYNQDLSDRRAKAVLAYLVGHGVDAGRLKAKGMGESKPIADNNTAEGKEKNRRVEFLIVEQEGGAQ